MAARRVRAFAVAVVAAALVGAAVGPAGADPTAEAFPAARAGTAEPGPDDPVAATVGGSVVSYLAAEPVYEAVTARWTIAAGNPRSVPRGTGAVELVIPYEASSLPLDGLTVVVEALPDGGLPGTTVAVIEHQLPTMGIRLDLPALLATAAERSISPVHHLRVSAGRFEDDAAADLQVDVVLTDEPAAAEQIVPMELPASAHRAFRIEGTPVPVARGSRVTLVTGPNFFNLYPALTPYASVWDASFTFSADVRDSVVVSDVGSRLTVTMPTLEGPLDHLSVQVGDETTPYLTWIEVDLLPSPADGVEAYVRSVYRDLFGRDPDPTGLAGWTGALTRGTPYSAVADAITASDEFRMGLIRDAYAYYLHREPDPAGLAGWLRAMNRGLQIQQMEAGFLASEEFYANAGGTDAAWVRALYVSVLERLALSSEVAAWLPAVAREGREIVARGFLYSTERLSTDVDGYYWWLLHRGSDAAGRAGWVRAIQGGHRVEEIIAGIIASQEYRGNVPVG